MIFNKCYLKKKTCHTSHLLRSQHPQFGGVNQTQCIVDNPAETVCIRQETPYLPEGMPIQAADRRFKKEASLCFWAIPCSLYQPISHQILTTASWCISWAERMQPDISYQVEEARLGAGCFSHSDPQLFVHSLGETEGADGGESGCWMPFPPAPPLHLRLACCLPGCSTNTVTGDACHWLCPRLRS